MITNERSLPPPIAAPSHARRSWPVRQMAVVWCTITLGDPTPVAGGYSDDKGDHRHRRAARTRVPLPSVINTCSREKDPFDARKKEPFEKPF